MRRNQCEVTDQNEMIRIMASTNIGRMATLDSDGYPYITPVNFVYFQDRIYFHCAPKGEKLDNLDRNPRSVSRWTCPWPIWKWLSTAKTPRARPISCSIRSSSGARRGYCPTEISRRPPSTPWWPSMKKTKISRRSHPKCRRTRPVTWWRSSPAP